jgi:hypothetical protein
VEWGGKKPKKRTNTRWYHLFIFPTTYTTNNNNNSTNTRPPTPNISFISISNHCACLPITSYLITHVVQRELRKEERKEKEGKEKVGKRKRSYDIRTLHACSRRKPKM